MKSKSVHLHCPTTEKLPLPWPSGGISNGHSPVPSELQLSCLLTNNQILKMEGKFPAVVGGLDPWSPGVVDATSGDAMEIIQQRSAADWELRQRDGRMGQLALRSQDGEGMRCTEERSNIKLLHMKTFWMQLWL